jgi:hypothetical protein
VKITAIETLRTAEFANGSRPPSAASDDINGQIIDVDGGMLAVL